MPDIQTILDNLARAEEETRTANETRYNEILGLLKGTQDQGLGQIQQTQDYLNARVGRVGELLGTSGATARADAGRRYQDNLAEGELDLINRGRAGSATLAQAMRRRAGEAYGRELETVRENTDRAQAGALMQTTQDVGNFMAQRPGMEASLANNVTGFMERRTDAYPDVGPYADLFAQLSQAQGATPGRSYSVTNAGGGSRRSGAGSGSPPRSGESRFGGAAGGGGGGGSGGGAWSTGAGGGGGTGGVWSTSGGSGVNSLGFDADRTPVGSRLFLGGRALGPRGELQGVGTSPDAPQLENPGFVQVRDLANGTSSATANGMMPPGWEGVDMKGMGGEVDRINAANTGSDAGSSGAGAASGETVLPMSQYMPPEWHRAHRLVRREGTNNVYVRGG